MQIKVIPFTIPHVVGSLLVSMHMVREDPGLLRVKYSSGFIEALLNAPFTEVFLFVGIISFSMDHALSEKHSFLLGGME